MIIYKIVNNINGKTYIGQTKGKLSQRLGEHIGKNLSYIGKALNKYGLESFTISIIDYADSKEVLSEKERYWIKTLNCRVPNGYNLTDGGEGTINLSLEARKKISEANKGRPSLMKGKHHSEEAKRKISEGNKGLRRSEETKKKMSMANMGNKGFLGKHHSIETREKIRKAMIDNKTNVGRHHSAETKIKLSEALKGNKHLLGKQFSAETRKKMAEAHKGKTYRKKAKG